MPNLPSWSLRTVLLLGTAVSVLTCSADASAMAIQPSFNQDGCAWRATHIVVVTEGDKIDGVVEVLESWKGDLKKGDRITVPELAAFAPEKERAVNYLLIEKTPVDSVRVTCSRMVLFLTKVEKATKGLQRNEVWRPVADWGGIKVSAAWIEAGRVYAFAQQINPGSSRLIPWGITEHELRTGVERVLQTRVTLSKALAGPDADKSAEAVLQFLRRTESSYLRFLALEVVGDSGEVGRRSLRRVLGEAALERQHGEAVWAMRKLPAAVAGSELTTVVTEELAYWRKAGPGLKKGWWDGVEMKADETERLRNRYGRAYEALLGLEVLHPAGCRDVVTAFRDYWKSLPQLGGELVQMTHACDSVLESLRRQ